MAACSSSTRSVRWTRRFQARLLKVLEDKRVTFESSYYDETASNVPEYVKRLFREGAPADFILIGATTREPEDIDPAMRSRCAEIFFETLTQGQILTIVQGAIKRLGVRAARGVAKLIASYTIEGRKGRADCRRRLRSGVVSAPSRPPFGEDEAALDR